jgi:hypothetical protein
VAIDWKFANRDSKYKEVSISACLYFNGSATEVPPAIN